VREKVDWVGAAGSSLLRKAVGCWRDDSDLWFEHAYDRLSETVRVNPLSPDSEWVENWLESIGCTPISWFNGVGSAWEMPFDRGKAEGETKKLLAALHVTGRLTRQEAVSMLPVIALDAQPGEVTLDMCASPGSKTTQIAEHLDDLGVVVANEVVRGRVNLLVSNLQRHRSQTAIVVNHDARHFPNVPESGYDRILVDAPCTGTGTTRKNPDVWRRWKPNSGRSMQKLQIDILDRAVKLTKPGGRIVYSTCSLDPLENEAVVAEILRRFPYLSLSSAHHAIPNIIASEGFRDWPILDDDCSIIENEEIRESFLPPTEVKIAEQLSLCMRVWNDQSQGGGFFLAVIEKSDSFQKKKIEIQETLSSDDSPIDKDTVPQPINENQLEMLSQHLGKVPDNLWVRGRKVLWATPEASMIWNSERSRRGGRTRIPGQRWRPLSVVHLGQEVAHLRKGEFERIVGSAAGKLAETIEMGVVEISAECIDSLLAGNEPKPEEVSSEISQIRGNLLLRDTSDGTTIPVWIGGRVTLMLRTSEHIVMCALRGVIFPSKSEEE